MSDFFRIDKAVRQGCPVYPYIFIICVELLSNFILRHSDIKVIEISHIEIYGSEKSFETLIDVHVLYNFSFISGLQLNENKMSLRADSFIWIKYKIVHNNNFIWTS